ncbi:MAG: RNA polymerase sigma factor [Oscillospiraceae bacterium]
MNKGISAEQLYIDYKDKVFGYIFNRIHNHAEAEDLTSDVFAKVVTHIDTYDPEKASPSTWVFVITRNTLIEYFRKQKQTEDIDELDIPVFSEALDGIILREEQEMLAEALKMLPEKMRDVIVARYYYGFRFAQIGEMMDMSEANARVTHARALAKLKEIIEKMP